jgi:hypothetical protein
MVIELSPGPIIAANRARFPFIFALKSAAVNTELPINSMVCSRATGANQHESRI